MTPNSHANAAKSDLAAIRGAAQSQQLSAADPAVSAWVGANAGTGKTHVLTTRVLRLMLAGTSPERILALTYTKAAAAEMSKRVFDRLAAWTTAATAKLEPELAALLGRPPLALDVARARGLFAAAIETPGGLKVQTIHAFCERLLQRFPLEAEVPPNFEILDDATRRDLQRAAVDDMLRVATSAPQSDLGRALTTTIAYASDDAFDTLLAGAIAERDWVMAMVRLEYEGASGLKAAERLYRQLAGLSATASDAQLGERQAAVLSANELASAIALLQGGKATDQKTADCLSTAKSASGDDARIAAFEAAFLTKDGKARADKSMLTKAIKDADAGLADVLLQARDRFAALADERAALIVVDATIALLHLANAVLQDYEDAKKARAALDFDDLIRKTAGLLSGISVTGSTSATAWVLFKLDGGLDHILVDEAQDTSPAQWAVVSALAREFFDGHDGASVPRTLFAVGDEKQSIYGFQGAVPRKFAEMGRSFAESAAGARLPWRSVAMTLSYRTVSPVLDTVDAVFADPARAALLTAGGAAINHVANRQGQAGLVELWSTEKPADAGPSDPWRPYDDGAATDPVSRLADRIADTVGKWLGTGEMLGSLNRPVRAGDILILVRRRRPLAPAIVAALKKRQIAVAGADRMRLLEQIAVEDLVALGDFLVLPEDDLALAAILKSPLFDLDDDDLIAIAPGRTGTLWHALLDRAFTDERFRRAALTLKYWRHLADDVPPYEFYSRLLEADDGAMRTRFLERLGSEAADPLDEFVGLALKYDETNPPTLQGFLTWLRASEPEIKRDMEQGRDEVRVMTVHGSKGLEAPIVILPDTCSTRSGGMPGSLLKVAGPLPVAGVDDLFLWPVKGSKGVTLIDAARAAEKDAETAERGRLLYVALTRARDRLYVTGYEGRTKLSPDSWYELVRTGLGERLVPATGALGENVWRFAQAQTGAHDTDKAHTRAVAIARPRPEWARRLAKPEFRLAIPLAPSRLAPLEVDDTGEPRAATRDGLAEPPVLPPSLLGDQNRFLRGTVTHALLQHLPAIPADRWDVAAARFVSHRAGVLGDQVTRGIVAEVLAILRDDQFAALFGPDSQAEVPIVAEIARPTGRGLPLRISGQADRIAITARQVLVVDYKTNRPPPADVSQVADAYLFQMAAYRLALARIFPDKTVRAAILWTDGPRIMDIPADLLDTFEARVWTLDEVHFAGPGDVGVAVPGP